MPSITAAPVASPRFLHRHTGLEISRLDWPESRFISITPSRGIAWYSRAEFAQNNIIYRIDHEPGWSVLLTPDQVSQRIASLQSRPYNLLGNNCDHLVKWLIGQSVESPQVQTVFAALAVGVLISRLA